MKDSPYFKQAELMLRAIPHVAAAGVFLKNESGILEGSFDEPLISTIEAKGVLDTIKGRSIDSVYAAQSVLDVEAAGFEVIGGLLEIFVGAATDFAKNGKGTSARSIKYLQLLPPRYRKEEDDPYKRLLRTTDYIAGMTDSFAVTLYKKIKGISLPNG